MVLCCLCFDVTWYHFRSVCISILSEFLCHFISLLLWKGHLCSPSCYVTSFCMGPCIAWVSMSLGLTSVLYVSLFSPSFYVTWSHFRSVWVSMLSEFPCHLVWIPLCMGPCIAWVSMSLGVTFVKYGSLCCLSFYVTWSHLGSVSVSMFSEFLCHLVSLPFFMYLYVFWVCMSLGLTSAMNGLCVVWSSISVLFYFYFWYCVIFCRK